MTTKSKSSSPISGSTRKDGLSSIHKGMLLIRGPKYSNKDGFTMDRFCVLVVSHCDKSHYILGFKTKNHWKSFQETFWEEFTSDEEQIDWDKIVKNDKLDVIIALKDTYIRKSNKPANQLEFFNQNGLEIYVTTDNSDNDNHDHDLDIQKEFKPDQLKTITNVTDQFLIGHNEDEYDLWIENIKQCAKVEKQAQLRRNSKQNKPNKEKSSKKQTNIKKSNSTGAKNKSATKRDGKKSHSNSNSNSTSIVKHNKNKKSPLVSVVCGLIGVLIAVTFTMNKYFAYQRRQKELEQQRLLQSSLIHKILSLMGIDLRMVGLVIGVIVLLFVFVCAKLRGSGASDSGKWKRVNDGRLSSNY